MAKHDPKRPNVATGSGRVPPKGKGKGSKTPPKKPPAKSPAAKGSYDWGDGHGARHSIPKLTHEQNVESKKYGIDLNAPAAAPLTARDIYGQATAAADRVYAPQIQANKTMQASVPEWFGDYITRAAAGQAALKAQSDPLLAQAQAGIQNAGAPTPGLDPNSPQAGADAQAAAGRAALAQGSANYLGGVAQAGQNYLGGQQAIAARELPMAQAQLLQQYGVLQGQRGNAVTEEYGRGRTAETNAEIARQTLHLNTANTVADNTREDTKVTAAATDKETTAAAKGKEPNKYGIPAAQWAKWSTSHRQRVIDDYGKKPGTAATDKVAKEAEKKKAAIQKATGTVKTQVADLTDKWDSYKGQQTDDTSKPKNPDGTYPARNLTPADIKRILGEKTPPGMIHVMLLVRAGKPLDKAAIDYLHSKDPNVRIPSAWLKGKGKAKTGKPGIGHA